MPFVVVLGAQTHGDRPSRTLRERLDLAAEYLEAHPAARVIVSGGQGADETQTEASVMDAYLRGKGIAAERIVQETQARTTREKSQQREKLAAEAGSRPNRCSSSRVNFISAGQSSLRGRSGWSRMGSEVRPRRGF